MTMRILLLSIQYPPDANATGRIMRDLAEAWVRAGDEVTVLTADPHYDSFSTRQTHQAPRDSIQNGVRVVRVPIFARGGKANLLQRLTSYLSYNFSVLWYGRRQRAKFDVIVCHNGSFFTGVSAWVLSRLSGRPFVLNVQDLYPEVVAHAGALKSRTLIGALRVIDRFSLSRAASVVVVSEALQGAMRGRSVPERRVRLIHNSVDTETVQPLPRSNEQSRHLNADDLFVVGYFGNLGYLFDAVLFVEAVDRLKADPSILFLVIGEGVRKQWIEAEARRRNLANLRILPYQPEATLPSFRAATDIQLSLYTAGASRFAFPSKVHEIMASGRPVIVATDPDSEVFRTVEAAHSGVCVAPGDVDGLVRAITRLHDDDGLRENMAQSGRRFVTENRSVPVISAAYREVLQQAIQHA